MPLGDLLGRLAASTPAPGGGTAAGLGCALAAALVEMAAGFAAPAGGPDAARRAARLRERALELAERDQESYAPVLDALALPSDSPGRTEALAAALAGAAVVPCEIVGVSAELAGLAAAVAEGAGRHAVGDAAVAAVLAEAACRAGAVLVEINLRGAPDERPTRAAQCVAQASDACRRALAKAHES